MESVHLSTEFPIPHHAQRLTSSASSGGIPMTPSHPGHHSSSSTHINRLPTSGFAADSWPVGDRTPVVHLVENHPCSIVCTALGGSPPPKMEITIERSRDLTPSTTLLQTISPMTPKGNSSTVVVASSDRSSSEHADGVWVDWSRRGFRLLAVTTVRSTRNYLPSADDDGRRLRCVVTVPGLVSRVDAVVLDVDCECNSSIDSTSLRISYRRDATLTRRFVYSHPAVVVTRISSHTDVGRCRQRDQSSSTRIG